MRFFEFLGGETYGGTGYLVTCGCGAAALGAVGATVLGQCTNTTVLGQRSAVLGQCTPETGSVRPPAGQEGYPPRSRSKMDEDQQQSGQGLILCWKKLLVLVWGERALRKGK